MLRYYEKTSYTIFYPSILFIIIAITYLISSMPLGADEIIPAVILSVYIILVVIVFVRITTARLEMKRIVARGVCRQGKVRNIETIEKEERYVGRYGENIKTCYMGRIVVAVTDESQKEQIYHSDLIYKRALKHLPDDVRVYTHWGKCCILWDKTNKKENAKLGYPKEHEKGYAPKMLLRTLNRTCMYLLILALIAIIIGYFVE